MATGLPVIALDAAGQADTVRAAGPECLIPIPAAEWVPYDPDTFGHGGERPVPDIQAVADGLRWVAGHRDDALALGRAAADWARRERDIRHKAPAVLDLMEEVVSPHTPLRRVPTLWTPSRGKACGVAEYAEHLASGLATHEGTTPARHIARPPDGHGMSVLHIQHEWGLFPDDAALTARVRAAKGRGVPVVVTQHTVRVNGVPHHPWQREADALVTLTESGAHRLRSQLPGRRVEWVPPGCPELVPPRKVTRGAVIGGFGFLFPQKGFGKLLDLLRARSLPNLELLLLSHTRDMVSEAAWERDAADLPVRRVRDFLSVEEIVHRLATEADILVFWYDAISVESASYAARIGLATGVPMLCSPTPWFHDLREVTYQPAGATDADLREGVARLLTDDVLRSRLTEASRDYCHRHRWAEIARQHRVLWSQLAAA
jgi:glycosyltransferase involved in cell wall biosynthesis